MASSSIVSVTASSSLLVNPSSRLADRCIQARRACMPPFVFSIIGQVEFRNALHHLARCSKRDCRRLRRQVLAGMLKKLHWLLGQATWLGCIHVQPYIFGARKITLNQRNFSATAQHLAHCPKESCAQLRRAMLLTIREQVSPNARLLA